MANSRNNNFDLIRLMLALVVVGQHLRDLSGSPQLEAFFKHFSGNWAVHGFFAISGYLIVQSYESTTSFRLYIEKRIRRLYPGYLVSILLFFVVSLSLSRYGIGGAIKQSETWEYLGFNLLFMNFKQATLPGVFETHKYQEINGALWTIKVEVMFYLCVPLISVAAKRLGVGLLMGVLVIVGAAYNHVFSTLVPSRGLLNQLPGQIGYFAVGGLIYYWRSWFASQRYWLLLVFVGLYIVSLVVFRELLRPLGVGGMIIWACIKAPYFGNWCRYGDLSYGIYVVHFPTIQIMTHLGLYRESPELGAVCTFLGILMLALMSWHLVEKRFLMRSSHYVRAMTAKANRGTNANGAKPSGG